MADPLVSRYQIKVDHLAAVLVTVGPLIYFLPALIKGLVITPDDGMLQNVPLKVAAANILWSGQFPMWNPYLFGGMPLLGAAQAGLLFPLNWLYLILSPALATNLMVLLTYMIAALGAYLFARRSGASVTGAAATGVIWSHGGFLVNQISHINIVQTAALLPWALWTIELYVRTGFRKHGALLAAIITLQLFAGHQQTFAYVLLLLIAYAVVMAFDEKETRNRYLSSLAYCAVGILLGAIQILPTWELLRNSVRATASYDFFTSFSMPKLSVITFLAPFVFGGGDGRIFKAPYIGQSFYTEYVPYAGVIAIMLALIALVFKSDRQTKFWGIVVVVGLLLAFGRYAPLSFNRLIYFVPVLNLFRVPARHLMEVHFAVAILAGKGLSCCEAKTKRPNLVGVGFISVIVILLTGLVVTWWRPTDFRLGREAPLTVLHAPELFVPIVFACVSAAVLWFLVRGRRGGIVLVLFVLWADLFIWGQFNGWYASSGRIPAEYWTVPESVSLLKSKASDSRYRILTTHLPFDPRFPVPADDKGWVIWTEPDIYMMHGIQNVAGYDGFGLQRYSELAGDMKLWGALTDPNATLRSKSRELDILSTRYVIARHERDFTQKSDLDQATSSSFPDATEKYAELPFAATDLSLPALSQNKRLSFKTEPVKANQIALLTNLSFAEDIQDKTVVARLHLNTVDGGLFEFLIRVGEHTADWAYDRPDIKKSIKHTRATVATSYDISDATYSYQGHTYVSSFELPSALEVVSGTIELDSQIQGATLSVFRISLIDSSGEKAYPLAKSMISIEGESPSPATTGDERWNLIAHGLDVNIYQNSRALPQAWMTSEVRELNDQETLQTIRTGVLPDGRTWDPLTTALVEPGSDVARLHDTGNVGFTRYRANSIKLKTDTPGTSLLVVSENDYPGWKAYVDGSVAPIIRVNYYLRGVVVPAGQHEVSFYYRPMSVIVGSVISLLTAVGLILFCFRK